MSVPNRKQEVATIAARYPQSFGDPTKTVDARRRLLMPILARELNKVDGEHWFLLNRLDRNDDDPRPGRLASDILVWQPTKEHVDVLSATGPMWTVYPAITDPDWRIEHWSNWPSWDDLEPPDDPPPPPPSTDLEARVTALEARVARHLKE